ncbi:MAG: hypothetical protein Q7U47_07650 [Paludibacter sp.]|nr:hypothetical protein [Paludibacter sp.]
MYQTIQGSFWYVGHGIKLTGCKFLYVRQRGVVCYVDRVRCRVDAGVDVYPGEFDKSSGMVKSRTVENKDKNLFINNVKRRITEIAVRYRLQNKKLTAELLMKKYELPDDQTSFYTFYEVELKKRKGDFSASTFEKYEITLKN